jgi:hypothetical protein
MAYGEDRRVEILELAIVLTSALPVSRSSFFAIEEGLPDFLAFDDATSKNAVRIFGCYPRQ